MKRLFLAVVAVMMLGGVSAAADTTPVKRVEPLSWWVGMTTDLQLLIQGYNISEYTLSIEGGKGVSVVKQHKADSPNYIFADVKISPKAKAGEYTLVLTKGDEQTLLAAHNTSEQGLEAWGWMIYTE